MANKDYIEDNSINGRRAEIEIKLNRVYKALDENAWDALYISKVEGFAWITAGGDNNITRSVENGCIGILITKKSRYAITNAIEYPRAIDEEKLEELGFEVLNQAWYENKTLEHIKRIIGQNGKLASDVPLPGAADANSAISKMQYSLTDNEIARYLHLGEVFSKAIEEVMLEIHPGDVEIDIVGRINNAIWKHNIDAILYLVAGDERIYKYRHCIPSENRIQKYAMVCCNGRYKGLVTKITRLVHFGEPDAKLIKQYQDNLEVENRMIFATKIGEDNLDAFRAAVDAYEEFGYHDMWKVHHQGGPQGYTNSYYGIHEGCHETVVKNQCYCYNPSITGTKTEDAFIVTESGPLMITKPILFPEVTTVKDGIRLKRPGLLIVC